MDYRLSPQAYADLDAILAHVSEHNRPAAQRLLDDFERSFERIGRFPLAGAARDDIRAGFRMMVVGSYLALYSIENDRVEIVRVIHGRRRL